MKTKVIAILGVAANIVLLVVKLIVGFLGNSHAMIADGFNSAGDVFASFMTYAGNRIASKPEDEDHPYGHGKAEYIFSLIISFSMMLICLQIFTSAAGSILHREALEFSWWLLGVAIFTIITKLSLYLYARKANQQMENLLVTANAEDHRNDIFVTSATLLGILFSQLGVYWMDGLAGIGISVWIGYTGVRIFMSSYHVLMDTDMDERLKAEITEAISTVEGVDHIDHLTSRPVGIRRLVIVKVSVCCEMTLHESHGVAARIREKLHSMKNIQDTVVHINPVDPV